MRFKSAITVGGLATALGLGALILALELQVSAASSIRGIDPASIDRTLKGDRLVVAPPPVRPAQRSGRLPEGCVEASDWHRATIYSAEIAGRCIS